MGRQFAWMIYEYFKVSDTDESVSDLNEILKVQLKNDNVQSVCTRWDETINRDEDNQMMVFWDCVSSAASTLRAAEAFAVAVHSRYGSKE